jgi:hypothetical protein
METFSILTPACRSALAKVFIPGAILESLRVRVPDIRVACERDGDLGMLPQYAKRPQNSRKSTLMLQMDM